MRIVYFGHYWTGYGGTEFDVRTMLTQLHRRGYECIYIGYDASATGVAKQVMEQEGVSVKYHVCDSPNADDRRHRGRLSALNELRTILQKNDILITIFPEELEAWRVARAVGAKVIQKYTIVYPIETKTWADLVDMHVFNSEACRDRWQGLGVVGPNMVIYPEIDMKVKKSAYRPKDGCIGLVNPTRHKGSEIFEKLAAIFKEEKFLAGGGWTVKKHGYTSDRGGIVYMKHMEDISDFYKQLKVLLVPTQEDHIETFGRIVLEGMYYGIPVMASDKDGIPEAADGAAVLIEKYDDVCRWSEALRSILKPKNLRKYHRKSTDRAKRYSLPQMMGRWEVAFRVLGGSQ